MFNAMTMGAGFVPAPHIAACRICSTVSDRLRLTLKPRKPCFNGIHSHALEFCLAHVDRYYKVAKQGRCPSP